MQKFKQNETTATYRRIYMFLASPADGYTPVTSLSGATVNLFRNGVAFGSQPLTPVTLTHISVGHWYYEIPQIYLSDLGILTVTVSDTNIRPVVLMAEVLNYDWMQPSGATAAQVWAYSDRQLTASLDPTASQIWANATRTLTASLDPTAAQIWANATRTLTASLDPTASQIWANATRTLTASLDPTAAQIADAVWDEPYNEHTTAQTFGKLMDILRKANYVTEGTVTSAVSPTVDSFSTNIVALDNTYNNQTVLFVSGDLAGESQPISQFLQSNGQINVETNFTLIPQVADNFVILPDHVHQIIEIADGILNRMLDSSGNSVDVFNERTVRSALRAMRNKVSVSNGTMAVYKEDDTEAAWEGTVSNTADVTVNPDGGSS